MKNLSQESLKRRFFFWQPALNPHEAGYIKSIAKSGVSCMVIAGSEPPGHRVDFGITGADYGDAVVVICRETDELPLVALDGCENDIHFFTGIRAFDITSRAFNCLRFSQAKLYLISESRDARGLKGLIRYLHSLIFESAIRKRINGVLAMGQLGVRWFKKTGYPKDKIFEFCYSINSDLICDGAGEVGEGEKFHPESMHIAFVGQLIERKNPKIIIQYCKSKSNENAVFHFFGDGVLRKELESISEMDSFGVVFHGALNNSEVRRYLCSIDIVVLPSLWDGWGAVVNEALMAGCRVFVSTCCGAASVAHFGGAVFLCGNYDSFVKGLDSLIFKGKVSLEERAIIREMANAIGGDSVAKYIFSIVDYSFGFPIDPIAPWLIKR